MQSLNKSNLLTASLLLLVITIPLHHNWNSIAIIAFCLMAVCQSPWKQSVARLKENKYWLLSMGFFLWLAATYFWDTSGGFTFNHIGGYAIFLIVPLSLTMMPPLSQEKIKLAMYVFTSTIILVSFYCLVRSYMDYNSTGNKDVFFYHDLSGQVGVNAIYYSNYCLAGICWLLYFTFIHKDGKLPVIVTILACLYLTFFIFLLSSKLVIVLTLFVLFLFTIYLSYINGKLFYALVCIALAGVFLSIVYSKATYLQDRVAHTKIRKYQGEADWQNGFSARLLMAQVALELISERPVLGYGLKGSDDARMQAYVKKNFMPGILKGYNSHNQYIETTLKAGLIGFLFFALLLFIPFIAAVRRGQMLPLVFLLQYMVQSLVEATLQVQHEQVFFWFFIFLFYLHFNKKTAVFG